MSDTWAAEIDEASQFAEQLRETMADLPRVWERPPEETRRANRQGGGPFGRPVFSDRAHWREIEGAEGPVRLRILPPASGSVDRVYLRIHGGGWVLGAADAGEPHLESLADLASALIVSVDYRLAPECPFPAGLDDCVTAALWLVDNSHREFGTSLRTIGGDSAGAHLSVMTLLRLREMRGETGFHAANLQYGCFDLGGTPSLLNWGASNLILDTPTVMWFRDQLLQGGHEPKSPEVSPLYADLRAMPPALFIVGTLDPLLDDSLLMAERWRSEGNEAELVVVPGGVHAFDAFDLAIARRARQQIGTFIRRSRT